MRHLRCVLAAFALSLTTSAFAQESSPPAPAVSSASSKSFEQLRDATELDRKGAQPFHLKMDVQIYDMNGKPSHTGTIEEWWVSPNEYRIETNSGSLHSVTATGQTNVPAQPNRDSYLLTQLWEKAIRPLAGLHPRGAPAESKQTLGSAQLDCFTMSPLAVSNFDPTQPPPTYCTDPGKQSLRLVRTGFAVLIRNSAGTFQGTGVALSPTIVYMGHPAVSGKITVLESFSPGSPGAPELQPDTPAEGGKTAVSVTVAGGIRGGRIIERTNPIHPPAARENHIGGAVLLHAVITKEGRIGSLFVIASPSELLSEAAMDAVHTWKYEPYLLNGKPAEVDTTVTVNFNMSH